MSSAGTDVLHLVSAHIRLLTCIVCAMFPIMGHSQVYIGASSMGGSVVLSNFQTQDAPVLLVAPISERTGGDTVKVKAVFRPLGKLPERVEQVRDLIDSVAQAVDVAPRLIHAVIAAESNFDPRAISPKGAIGLMQLLPATAKRFGVQDPFIVRDNIFAGASYLKWLMAYFSGDLELVLAAYNAGEQAVIKAGRKVPQYPETQAYVRRIMADLHSSGALPL